jgi:hypothetical protein
MTGLQVEYEFSGCKNLARKLSEGSGTQGSKGKPFFELAV